MNNTIYIKITDNCNLACPFCYVTQENNILDTNKTIEFINKYKPKKVVFHGGEPLLYHDKILDIINNTNTNYSITSNLVLPLTEQRLYVLDKCKLATSYSVDRFADKNILKTFINNILYLQSINKQFTLLITLTQKQIQQDIYELKNILDILKPTNITLERVFLENANEQLYIDIDKYLLKLFYNNIIPNNNLLNMMKHAIHSNTCVFPHNCDCKTLEVNQTLRNCPNGNYIHKKKRQCLDCDIYQYCKNDCPTFGSKSFCTFPKNTFKYILKKEVSQY